MKNRLKRVCCTVMIIAAILAVSSFGEGQSIPSDAVAAASKEETVYALLNCDGSLSRIVVVNRVSLPSPGNYYDTGAYSSVSPLTGAQKPVMAGGRIYFAADSGSYSYSGVAEGTLPFEFDISYTLDGTPAQPEALIGASGHIVMSVTVTSLLPGYLCQLQVPLNLSVCSGITASGGQSVTVGATRTYAFMAFPGIDGAYTVEFDAAGFSMDSIQATASRFDISALGIEGLAERLSLLEDGTAQLSEGYSQLSNALTLLLASLQSDPSRLTAAEKQLISAIQSGLPRLSQGIADYTGGIGQALQTVSPMLAPSQPPRSFADPEREIDGIQFVFQTPELRPVSTVSPPRKETDNRSFADRFLDLFR